MSADVGRAEERTRAILDYDVLGKPRAPDLQALVELAAHVCSVSTAVINLMTTTQQHQVAAFGVDPCSVDLGDSMCATTVDLPRPVVLPDARDDPRFADNPHVTGILGNIRFYAASQLRTPSGLPVGTLCVFDERVHRLQPAQARALDALATQVVDALELRRRSALLREALLERDLALAAAAGARRELQRSNEALSAFAGQVSHDLRNPLAAVSACLETLADLDVVTTDAEARQFVDLGRRAAGGMHELVDRLLTYARVGGGVVREPVDLAALVDDVLAGLEPLVTRAGATVVVGDLPEVATDRVQLRAVVENLLTNALKFRAHGRRARITLDARRTATGWRLEVADNGIGIPAASRDDVFGAFRRLAGSTGVDGFGLGLATCRRIVEAHGGEIGVEETLGGGTTVWLTLPG